MFNPPIGTHRTLDSKIDFIDMGDSIQAQVPNQEALIPVELPENPSHGILSLRDRVARLLQNRHLLPVYSSEKNRVYFATTPSASKTWKKRAELALPPHHKVEVLFRADGTISYACINSITTWDWVSNKQITTPYMTSYITALAERSDGSLVVGDEKGQLHFSEKILPLKNFPIKKITPISSNHCLIEFSGYSQAVFDFKSEKILLEFESSHLIILDSTKIIAPRSGQLTCYEYQADRDLYVNSKVDVEAVESIELVFGATVLILQKNQGITLWNTKSNTFTEIKNDKLWIKSTIDKVIHFDETTWAFSDETGGNTHITFYEQERKKTAECAGKWTIIDMILLSDGSIMYGTDTRGSGIHVVQRNGKVIFSQSEELTNDRKIHSLTELIDGSVAVRCADAIFILEPQVDPTQSIQYQIDKLNLELRYNPYKLKLYAQLGTLYKNRDKRYQTYLLGLQAAAKKSNVYRARRFCEKAKKIYPDDNEPSRLFEQFLAHSPHKRFKADALPEEKKKYRNRLFVGEGDFTFTKALLKKHKKTHPTLGQHITATELNPPVDETVIKRVESLMKHGVKVVFGLDAQAVHLPFSGKRFQRIQWNCPFGDASPESREAFTAVLPQFFESASQLQLPTDRIHVTLVQGSGEYWKTRQKENPIVLAATAAGYRLIRKRNMEARYAGYIHTMTNTTQQYTGYGKKREFVFEKTEKMPQHVSLEEACTLQDPKKKKYSICTDEEENPQLADYYIECSTDEDSSDYA